jgi:hypothetical protein
MVQWAAEEVGLYTTYLVDVKTKLRLGEPHPFIVFAQFSEAYLSKLKVQRIENL